MMFRRRKRYVLLASCLALILCVVAHRQILPCVLTWLDVGEVPTKTQAAFVLFGNNDTRPFVAAALYKAGFVKEILMAINSPLTDTKQIPPSHLAYTHVFLNRGVAREDIRMLGTRGTTNTMNESSVLLEYLVQNPEATVTVVTTHFHTRRTRWSLRRHAGRHAHRLRFVSAPHDDFRASDWWQFPRGFELVLMEYVKLFGYWVCYGNALWYFAGALLAAGAWGFAHRKVRRERQMQSARAH